VDIDKQRNRRNWSLLLGPLFLFSAVYFYDQTGLGRHFRSNLYSRPSWQFEHRTRIGNLPLSLSDFYFEVAIFCGVCGVIYFVLSNVGRRPLEILLGYAHFLVSIVAIALVVSYIENSAPADPLEPIPSVYWSAFLLAQVLFLLYIAWAMFSAPPEE
jgi:hypothetical protein